MEVTVVADCRGMALGMVTTILPLSTAKLTLLTVAKMAAFIISEGVEVSPLLFTNTALCGLWGCGVIGRVGL